MSTPTDKNSPNNKSKALGRGFAALLPNQPTKAPAVVQSPAGVPAGAVVLGTPVRVPIERVKARPDQPRKTFEPMALEELRASIQEKGILQPLVVQPDADGNYMLIAGERRLRAATLAGLKDVPIVVRPSDAEEVLELALIENIQRENLNPVEEANGYYDLISRFGLSQEDVAKKVGKSRSAVANSLRLLNLPPQVVQLLVSSKISAGQARPLLGLMLPEQMTELAQQIVREGLSARQVEERVAQITGRAAPLKPKESTKATPTKTQETTDANLKAVREDLRRHLATKVEIREKNGSGEIAIHFYSREDLNRILTVLGLG